MGTNFYLKREDAERYLFPEVMNWIVAKAEAVRLGTYKSDDFYVCGISTPKERLEWLVRWFCRFMDTMSDEDLADFQFITKSFPGTTTSPLESYCKVRNSLYHEKNFQDTLKNIKEDFFNGGFTRKTFKPMEEDILNRVVLTDWEDPNGGAHIGKRSAAGKYCFNCNHTACNGGVKGVHQNGSSFSNECPICGRKTEYTYSFTFQWSKEIWKRIFEKADTLSIYDEYDREFTKEEFLQEELGLFSKIPSGNFWDFELIYEEESNFC